MSRLKVAAQLIQAQEYKTALDMLKRDDTSKESFYWRSLICRLFDWYDDEKKIIDAGIQKHRDFAYLQERLVWHKKPLFDKMVPRQPVIMPKDPITIPQQSTIDQLCFVTGGDSNYFTLIVECIESIRHTPTYKNCAVCVLDCGLTSEEKQYLIERLKVQSIKDPGWDVDCELFHRYSPSRDQTFTQPYKEFGGVKSMTSRLFMKKHFPGYRYYMWIDGDAWIQDERAIDQYLYWTQKQYCSGAIHCNGSIKNAGFLKPAIMDEAQKAVFGDKPTFASGVFCIDGDTPFFDEAAKVVTEITLKYGYGYALEECILNYLFYKHQFSHILPYECNYRFSPGLPIVVADDPVLRNPHNHQVIGILHLPSPQKEKFYCNTHNISGPLSHEDLQKHSQFSNQAMFNPDHPYDPSKFGISIRFRTWPWENKPLIKQLLKQEIGNV